MGVFLSFSHIICSVLDVLLHKVCLSHSLVYFKSCEIELHKNKKIKHFCSPCDTRSSQITEYIGTVTFGQKEEVKTFSCLILI